MTERLKLIAELQRVRAGDVGLEDIDNAIDWAISYLEALA